MKKSIRICLFVLVIFYANTITGQIKSVSDFLDFTSMGQKEREYKLLSLWTLIDFDEGFSESGDSFWRELKYKGKTADNEKYELSIGSVIEASHADNVNNIETSISYYFLLKLTDELNFNKWMQELKELGIEFEEYKENNEVNWIAFLDKSIYEFNRIFLTKKKVTYGYEYLIQINL